MIYLLTAISTIAEDGKNREDIMQRIR